MPQQSDELVEKQVSYSLLDKTLLGMRSDTIIMIKGKGHPITGHQGPRGGAEV
jgi:hypothetical protein